MTYKFAAGHVDPTTTSAVDPQPKSSGFNRGVRKITGNGGILFDGKPSTRWVYTMLTPTQLSTLLSAFGLSSADSAECTITTAVDQDRAFDDFEATVNYPDLENKFSMGTWKDVVFEFVSLVGV